MSDENQQKVSTITSIEPISLIPDETENKSYTPRVSPLFGIRRGIKCFSTETSNDNNDDDDKQNKDKTLEHYPTPLSVAAHEGLEDIVRFLLKSKEYGQADINIANVLGTTPLNFACRYDENVGIVKILLEHGADPNVFEKTGDTPLMTAAYFGNENIVTLLLGQCQGLQLNHQDKWGETALYKACSKGHSRICKLLLDFGANVNIARGNKDTPLIIATYRGYVEIVRLLLKSDGKDNIDPNYIGNYGHTALRVACSNGYEEIVELLLEHGASVNILDEKGESPLAVACRRDYDHIVETLFFGNSKNDAIDVNTQDEDGDTPLFTACKQKNEGIVRLLLQHKADVNIANNARHAPLIFASRNAKSSEILRLLLKEGNNDINVNITNGIGQTPLHSAVKERNTEAVRILLSFGNSNVNHMDAFGETPLAHAAKNKDEAIVKLLIQCGGADLTHASLSSWKAPLFIAIRSGSEGIVDFLLANGADPNQPSEEGCLPLFQALSSGEESIFRTLLHYGAKLENIYPEGNTPLHLVARDGHESMVQSLLEYYNTTTGTWTSQLTKENNFGRTALYEAIFHNNPTIACELLQHFTTLDVNYQHKSGSTYLHLACKKGQLGVCQVLVQRNAKIELQKQNGYTPLLVATKAYETEIVEFLIDSGANIHHLNSSGKNALILAAAHGRTKEIHLLLKAGATVGQRTKDGNTALSSAILNGKYRAVEILLKHKDTNIEELYGNELTPLHSAIANNQFEIAKLLLKCGANTNHTDCDGNTPLHTACEYKRLWIVKLLLEQNADVNVSNNAGLTPLAIAYRHGHIRITNILLGQDDGSDDDSDDENDFAWFRRGRLHSWR